jgi:hypothetical protein
LRVSKIRNAYNEMRRAIRAGDLPAAERALDRYEQWADFIFDERHRQGGVIASASATPSPPKPKR